jgi:starch synthase (maltosyl-transferring)
VIEKPDGLRRVVIDSVRPMVDGGGVPIKRTLGDRVVVEADLLADGHDKLAGRLLYRKAGAETWQTSPLRVATAEPAPDRPAEEDRWWAAFVVDELGTWEYTVAGWVDAWQSWLWAVTRKRDAGQSLALELRGGARLLGGAAERATGADRAALQRLAERLAGSGAERPEVVSAALAEDTSALMRTYPDDRAATRYEPPLTVIVDPVIARFGSWYEMFPRSRAAGAATAARVTTSGSPEEPVAHGTFKDAEARLDYIADLGFDVIYLPPIHPIGRRHRKGPDNSLTASANDPGSPWAIGSAEGGHRAVHPQLGTIEDFRRFVAAARARGLEVALDIAFQASPDHPYVAQHPEWFFHRPDGTIQFAENPPKKYEDIYPFDFAGEGWRSLWDELRDVLLHWIAQGVTVFRVDNPHTKPLPFWRWCIADIKAREPRAVFLSEAFTRPKLMRALAKAGFSQSYTYFTWRTTKSELTEYVRSLCDGTIEEYFRPNFWPNTPDILPEHLQHGTRATFIARAVLAATLSPSWGVYGPAFELQERVAREGSEEYAANEKYQLRVWDLDRPDSLAPVLRRLNRVRAESPCLHRITGTAFHHADNDALICYSRATPDRADVVLVVVNLDPHHRQAGWLSLDLDQLGVEVGNGTFQVHDLLGDSRHLWSGRRAYVDLDPRTMPAHVFRIRRRVRSERSFEYFQ